MTKVTINEMPNGDIWSPDNSGGGDEGMMNYMEALAKSKNQVTARLMKALGPELVCQYAKNCKLFISK